MTKYEVGDKVVYSPHGAGVVVAKETRDDAFGEYLSIRIAHSKLTLMVPAAAADEKGVRPIVSATTAKKIVKELAGDAGELPADPNQRARLAMETTREGDAAQLADMLRDYTGLARNGKKLTAAEQRSVTSATMMLASEIALARDIEFEAATEQLEQALALDD